MLPYKKKKKKPLIAPLLVDPTCPAALGGLNPRTIFLFPLVGLSLVNNLQAIRSPSPRRNLDPALDNMSSSPFVPAILNHDAPSHFALPKFQMYDGFQDPFDHLMHFCQIMMLQTGNNALLCKVFPSSLAIPALSWFHRLAPNTVTSFCCLSEKFVTQYMCSVRRKQSASSLFHVRMRRFESIRDFMKHFRTRIL